jgi:tetrahydromethanopterin S-methyltransferase subunit G
MAKKKEDLSIRYLLIYLKAHHDKQSDQFDGIHQRLDKLNGQVEKNTQFRLIHIGAYKLICVIGAIITVVVGWYLQ